MCEIHIHVMDVGEYVKLQTIAGEKYAHVGCADACNVCWVGGAKGGLAMCFHGGRVAHEQCMKCDVCGESEGGRKGGIASRVRM